MHLARVEAKETVQQLAQRAEVAARTLRLLACQRKILSVRLLRASENLHNICNAAARPSGQAQLTNGNRDRGVERVRRDAECMHAQTMMPVRWVCMYACATSYATYIPV